MKNKLKEVAKKLGIKIPKEKSFWRKIRKFSRKDRKQILDKELWGEDDLMEWQELK